MADNYIKNNADRMLELLKGGPSDLIRAAEIGCDTLNSIYDDDEFKAHINRLSGRPFIDDSESVAWAGDVEAIKWTSRRWEPGLLSEFPFFLNQVRKVMLEHKIEPGLVDDICRQAEELRQTGGKWTGDVRTFFAIIRHTADEICRLREVIEENPENEAILNDARNKLLNAVYVMAGITCISSTTFALLNPDFRNFIIALANALASTYFSLAAQSSPIPRNTPNYQAKRKLQRGVYISIILALLVLLSSIIIYLRFTSIHTSHPIPTASAVGSSEPHPLSFDKDFYGYFYVNPNGSSNGTFDRTSSSPSVITESFSVIDFNPNSGKMCSNTIVNTRTKPFTDVYNSNGRCELIPVESGSDTQAFQAGVGNLQYFEAVFLPRIHVPGKGTLTMYITADDGWIISIGKDSNGDQPTPKQTIMAHPTKTKKSPIKNYPEIGDNNVPSEPILRSIKVNFPAAGVYPVEIDYTECCGDQMTLVITNDFTPVQS